MILQYKLQNIYGYNNEQGLYRAVSFGGAGKI